MDTWPEMSPDRLKWMERLAILGLIVNTVYLFAGIFFLKRKSFSLVLMYSALIISLLYVFIPMFFIEPLDDLIFVLIGPFIDLCLLFGVIRIKNHYHDNSDKVVKPLGEIKISPPVLKVITLLAVFCLSVPIMIQAVQIHVMSLADNREDMLAILQNNYPGFLHSFKGNFYISLTFCLIAIVLSSIGLKLSGKVWRYLNTFILVIACLLLFLNLFQNM